MKPFKIYVVISLLVIILLLGALVGSVIYAGKKISSESATVTTKVNNFTQSVNGINKNLQLINGQLQTENTNLSGRASQPQ